MYRPTRLEYSLFFSGSIPNIYCMLVQWMHIPLKIRSKQTMCNVLVEAWNKLSYTNVYSWLYTVYGDVLVT